MRGAAYWCSALVVGLCALGEIAYAAGSDVTDLDRTWVNFNREAAVLGNNRFWVELRGVFLRESDAELAPLTGYPVNDFNQGRTAHGGFPIDDIDAGRFDLVGAYGLGKNAELGLELPFVMPQQIEFNVPSTCDPGVNNCEKFEDEVGPGDLVLYGKYKHMFTEQWAGALGLEMSIPTGDRKKLLGSGELGLNPFLSTRYQSGWVAVGGHVGFELNTNNQADVFNWSVETILRGTSLFSLRIEIDGRLLRDFGTTFNDITVYPGIDFNLTENFIIRPQGIAGITDEAVDWGLGIGFVFTI